MKGTRLVLLAATLLAVLALAGAARAQTPSITLDWNAPGDDGSVGTAATYEMRWRAVAPDTTSQATIQSWWNLATPVTGLPAPQIAGSAQSVTVSPAGGFQAGTYYFVMRAADEVPNWSLFSNVATKVVNDTSPQARVVDLRTR